SELSRIIARALLKKREDRYQTVADLASDLKRLAAEMDVSSSGVHSRLTGDRAAPGDPHRDSGDRSTIPAEAARTTVVAGPDDLIVAPASGPGSARSKTGPGGLSASSAGIKRGYAGIAAAALVIAASIVAFLHFSAGGKAIDSLAI